MGGSTLAVQYGKVGVGTSTPSFLLHVSSAPGVPGDLLVISTGASNVIRMTGAGEIYANKFYGDISGAAGLPAGDNLGSHIATVTLNMAGFAISDAGAVTASSATITGSAFSVGGSTLAVSAGNVGIGTNSPGYALEIKPSGMAGFQVEPQAGYISLRVNGVEVALLEP